MPKRAMMPNSKIQQVLVNAAPSAVNDASATQSLSDLVKSLAPSGGQSFSDALLDVSQQLNQVKTASRSQADIVAANTQALTQNTAAQGSGKGVGAVAGNVVSSLLGNVLSALPLFSSLAKLFTDGTPTPPPLVRYAAPSPITFQAGQGEQDGTSQNTGGYYDQFGQPRPSTQNPIGLTTILGSNALQQLSAQGNSPLTNLNPTSIAPVNPAGAPNQIVHNVAPQITVQVQAMDSRSFMDHSHDIAQAVREAMLNAHALNDVVNDL